MIEENTLVYMGILLNATEPKEGQYGWWCRVAFSYQHKTKDGYQTIVRQDNNSVFASGKTAQMVQAIPEGHPCIFVLKHNFKKVSGTEQDVLNLVTILPIDKKVYSDMKKELG